MPPVGRYPWAVSSTTPRSTATPAAIGMDRSTPQAAAAIAVTIKVM